MTKTGLFFRKLGARLTLLFHGNLPDNWQEISSGAVKGLNIIKSIAGGILTVEKVFGKNFGEDILTNLIASINNDILAIEIADGAKKVSEGLTGSDKANSILTYIGTRIKDMPEKWRGKHFLDIATTIVAALLNVSTTIAGSIVLLKYGEGKTKS